MSDERPDAPPKPEEGAVVDTNESAQPTNFDSESVDATRFVRLLSGHECHLRSYLFTLVSTTEVVDELMQEVSVVLWKKFAGLRSDDGFLPWAMAIARYEVLMYRRRVSRDRLVFDEDLITMLSTESLADDAAGELYEQCRSQLRDCVQKLKSSDQKLLAVAYGREGTVVELSETLGCTVNSLYKTLGRLRRRLKSCVESERGVV